MGWAAGDVSLAAYIQSTLSQSQYREFNLLMGLIFELTWNTEHPRVSPLGAVMVSEIQCPPTSEL